MTIKNAHLFCLLSALVLVEILKASLLHPLIQEKYLRKTSSEIQPQNTERAIKRKRSRIIASATGDINKAERTRSSNVNSQRQKPWFVVHVGPPKTATSTIQGAATKMRDVLALDNYTYPGIFMETDGYVGQDPFMKNFRNVDCHKKLSEIRVLHSQPNNTNGTLYDALYSVNCWKPFVDELNVLRAKGKSILLSDEGFTFRWYHFEGIGWAPLDWISLRATLRNDWNFLVVVGYRRYVDWLPSQKNQKEKNDRREWPGYRLMPLFPNFVKTRSYEFPHSYTDHVLMAFSPFVPIKMFNMHADRGVRSTFLCDVLPNAPHSCSASLTMDQEASNQVINPSQSMYYDMLGIAASGKGLFNVSSMDRLAFVDAAEKFHEKVLNQTVYDFPLICPDHQQLETFLNVSVDLEANLMPELHASSQGEPEHRANFWKAAAKKKYCTIDTEATLQDETWKGFFKELH